MWNTIDYYLGVRETVKGVCLVIGVGRTELVDRAFCWACEVPYDPDPESD